MPAEDIGTKLRDIRLAMKKTQEDIAEDLNVAVSTVRRIENGERPIKIDYLQKFCNLSGIPIAALLGDSLSADIELPMRYEKLTPENKWVIGRILDVLVEALYHSQKK